MYLAHPVFKIYRYLGAVAYRQYITKAIRRLLGPSVATTNLPAAGRVSLMHQPGQGRYILHLLYANTILRGGKAQLSEEGYVRDTNGVELIEDLPAVYGTKVSLAIPQEVKRVNLQPQDRGIAFVKTDDGRIELTIEEFTCHQMVVLHYK